MLLLSIVPYCTNAQTHSTRYCADYAKHCAQHQFSWLNQFLSTLFLYLCIFMSGKTMANTKGADYYSQYDLKPKAGVINFAVQPSAWPLAFISSTMQHDKILRAELKQRGLSLRAFSFKKGNDIVLSSDVDSFAMSFMGDMPTVNLSLKFPISIAGLGKRNFSSVVSRDYSRLEELRGKKIAYSAGSSSHLVLLRGLKSVNLTERDVQLIPLEPANMPQALEDGTIDAFSAWEPTPAISLNKNNKNKAIYKGLSTDWVVLSKSWANKNPDLALLLMASYVRSINWMRHSGDNLHRAATWVLADFAAFTGSTSQVSIEKAIDIVRKDLLEVPGAPSIPSLVDGVPPLSREFNFLKELGRLPANASDTPLRDGFRYEGLRKIQSSPKIYRTFQFDYDN